MARLLVVDDVTVDRQLVGGLLAHEQDFQIDYATNGAEALESIRRDPPDLVVTDLCMPEMDGLELVKAVCSDWPLLPIILITAEGSEEVALRALRAGAASYTPKRELARDLLANVRSVMAVAQQQREQARLLDFMTGSSFSFVLENDTSLIAPLVGLMQKKLSDLVIDDESERLRMGIALEEALTNALYHGNLELDSEMRQTDDSLYYDLARQRAKQSPYQERRIYVEARQRAGEVEVVIRDEGPGFDPTTLPDPTAPENLDRAFGRGMLLIRTFMDEVRHNAKGNEITLIKRGSASAAS